MAVNMFLNTAGVTGEFQITTDPAQMGVLALCWGMGNSGSAHVMGGRRPERSTQEKSSDGRGHWISLENGLYRKHCVPSFPI
jgi:hypothetical protein